MKVNSDIDTVIRTLQSLKEEGYKTVEVLTKSRANGWKVDNPYIEFLINELEPTVVGISVRQV